MTESVEIYYDPDPRTTVIDDDEELVASYFEVPEEGISFEKMSPWLLRIELNKMAMIDKNLSTQDIANRIHQEYTGEFHCIFSDDNDDKLVLRIRIMNNEENMISDSTNSKWKFLKELEGEMLERLWLKGVSDVTKVVMKEVPKNEITEDGSVKRVKEWRLETDGCHLSEVFGVDGVDYTRTMSNDLIEVANVLGIEAVR